MPLAKRVNFPNEKHAGLHSHPVAGGIIWALTTLAAWHKNMQFVTAKMTDLGQSFN